MSIAACVVDKYIVETIAISKPNIKSLPINTLADGWTVWDANTNVMLEKEEWK